MKLRAAPFDPPLMVMALGATVLGLIAIWDAGYARAAEQGAVLPRELQSQVMFVAVALLAGWLCACVRKEKWRRFGWWACALSFVGVLLVEAPGLGVKINGAVRWFRIGPITVQPAEFAKLGIIIFLAAALCCHKPWVEPKRRPRDWGQKLDWVWVPKLRRAAPLLWAGALALIIEQEPDLATAMVLATITFTMLVVGGVSRRSLLVLLALVACGGTFMAIKEPYRIQRIANHAQRWSPENLDDIGYQTTTSEAAMASGGLFGVGLGNGRAKHTLPAPTTDFIMATIGEEFGLIGSLGVVALMGGIVWRLMRMAERAGDRFGKLFATGVATWIAVQACTNMVMANGKFPPIGIPLPFISCGGSSLVVLWMALGIVHAVTGGKAQEVETVEASRNGWRNRRTRISGA